jgi:hypothetical protein
MIIYLVQRSGLSLHLTSFFVVVYLSLNIILYELLYIPNPEILIPFD